MMDDRNGNGNDPGGTPEESSADEADITHDEIYETMDAELLVSSFGDASTSYTCSSVGDMIVSADGGVDPISIPRNARAAIKDPIYAPKWPLAMEAEVKGKFEINLAWKYVYEIPAGRKVMKGKWVYSVKYNDDGSVKLFKARCLGWLWLLADRGHRLPRDL